MDLTVMEAQAALRSRAVSALELAEAAIERAGSVNPDTNAFVHICREQALRAARQADTALARGDGGPLAGIPLGVKDAFCTAGIPTSAGSRILRGFIPPYESTVTSRLLGAGAVIIGKTSMDEFAMGSTNETSASGPVVNPWSPPGQKLVPGGSSGGSAAAVASRAIPAAIGTDTGGSIRQPAAFCGVTGIKPTYGRCSRFGIIAYASSLDQAGPIARTVADCAALLSAMAGFDPNDSTSVERPVPDFGLSCRRGIRGLRIGIPSELAAKPGQEAMARSWQLGMDWLRDAGAEIVSVSLPSIAHALPAYYIVAMAEASSNLARYDGVRFGARVPVDDLDSLYAETRAAGFGAEVRRRILLGTFVLSHGYYDAYYVRAQRVRTLVLRDFEAAFGRVDAILTPTAPTAAYPIGDKADDPLAMWMGDALTVPVNLAGLPAISVPSGLDPDGLPLGLQLIGRAFDEETLFAAGSAIERASGFTAVPPACQRD